MRVYDAGSKREKVSENDLFFLGGELKLDGF